jgi:hypothetical protein
MTDSELDKIVRLALDQEFELAEFIVYLIYRIDAHEDSDGCEFCQIALDRTMWPDHPVMAWVTELLDNP